MENLNKFSGTPNDNCRVDRGRFRGRGQHGLQQVSRRAANGRGHPARQVRRSPEGNRRGGPDNQGRGGVYGQSGHCDGLRRARVGSRWGSGDFWGDQKQQVHSVDC